ncbi:LysR family transcriptional regulator [Pokkaliibacter sp. MBI-7]|uniref:LysR family transcriptional regulator n=1 Tax=Pokkaliibacter sp. MBI-7 TaxID=3040600 RepID=UPI0024472DC9|nr:LysR family transcriptional regulator [Pokkaliibacter sp. MBI-7]MDH2435534.1 LysR family transcriptional regulator [Pokkaliibacter sp. MBI-7]
MHFRKLDLNLLVALDALIRKKSVSLAAEELHLSQSAMSNSLSRLRSYFNDELLTQVGRKMLLTPLAEKLELPVRDILVRIDASITLKPEFDPQTTDRTFRICVSDFILNTLVPSAMQVAREQQSRVRFNFVPQVIDPKKELERGEADMLILPDVFCSSEHPTESVLTDELACIVWQGSPLATGDMTLERFISAGHAIMQPPDSNPSFETHNYERSDLRRRIEVQTYSFSCLPSVIIGTDLIATLQRLLIDRAINCGMPLRVFPTPVPIPPLNECMQWHKHQNNDLGILWLRGLMREAARRLRQAMSE